MQVVITYLNKQTNKTTNQLLIINSNNYNEFISKQKEFIRSFKILEFYGAEDFKILLEILRSCTYVSSINLSGVVKKFVLDDKLLQILALLTSLETLKLENIGVESAEIELLRPMLIATKIKNLSLANNNIGDNGVAILMNCIEQMHNITSLDLSYSNISPIGCNKILSLLKIKKIDNLVLAGNHISEEQILAFSEYHIQMLRKQEKNVLPIVKNVTATSNVGLYPLDHDFARDAIYVDAKDLITGDEYDDREHEFWQALTSDINNYYCKISSKELFSENLNSNMIMNDFSKIFGAKSFQELHDQLRIIEQNKKLLRVSALKFAELDFSKIKIEIFISKIKSIILNISKTIAAERNFVLDKFNSLLQQTQLFYTSGIGFVLQKYNLDLYTQLMRQSPCNNIEDFKKSLHLIKNCCIVCANLEYSNIALYLHDDLEFNLLANNINKALEIINNNIDQKYTSCFDVILDQYNKDLSQFSLPIQISNYNDDDSNILKIEGNSIKASEIYGDMFKNVSFVQSIMAICKGSFILDVDIALPSTNLTIFSANACTTLKNKSINLSPQNQHISKGRSGRHAVVTNGSEKANSGADGEVGEAGKASGNFTLIAPHANDFYKKIKIIANGNNGADGGDAGNGADGKNGDDGNKVEEPRFPQEATHELDYIHYLEGNFGKKGTQGGDSGCPAPGGLGGSAGVIQIIDLTNNDLNSYYGSQGDDGKSGELGKPGIGGKNGLNTPELVKRRLMTLKFGSAGYFRKFASYNKNEAKKLGRFRLPQGHEFNKYYLGFRSNYAWPQQYKDENDPEFTQKTFAANGEVKSVMTVQQNRNKINSHSMQDIVENIKKVASSQNLSRALESKLVEKFNKLTSLVGSSNKIATTFSLGNFIEIAKIERTVEAIYHKSYGSLIYKEADNIETQANNESAYQTEFYHPTTSGIDKFSILQNNFFQKKFISLNDVTLPSSFLNYFSDELNLTELKKAIEKYNECRTLQNLNNTLFVVFNLLLNKPLLCYYLSKKENHFFSELGNLINAMHACYLKIKIVPPIINETFVNKEIIVFPYPYVANALNNLYENNYKVIDNLYLLRHEYKKIYFACFLSKNLDSGNRLINLIKDERFISEIYKAAEKSQEYENYNFLNFAYKVYITLWLNLEFFISKNEINDIYNTSSNMQIIKHESIKPIADVCNLIVTHIDFFINKQHLQPVTDIYTDVKNERTDPRLRARITDEWRGLFNVVDFYMIEERCSHAFVLNSWANQKNTEVFYGYKARFEHYNELISNFNISLKKYNDLRVSDKENAEEILDVLIKEALDFAKLGNFSLVENILTLHLNADNTSALFNIAYICKLMGYNSPSIIAVLNLNITNNELKKLSDNFNILENIYKSTLNIDVQKHIKHNINLIIYIGLRKTLYDKYSIAANVMDGFIDPSNLVDIFISTQFNRIDEVYRKPLKNELISQITKTMYKGFNLYRTFDLRVADNNKVKDLLDISFTNELFSEFLKSHLFTRIFDKNKYDFVKMALYEFCKQNRSLLLELATFIFDNNICHTYDLDKLQILYCLYPLLNCQRYKDNTYLFELKSIFVSFKNYPINSLVTFIVKLNDCDQKVIDQLVDEIFTKKLKILVDAKNLQLMPFYDYISLLNNNKHPNAYSFSELATINSSIEYVNTLLSRPNECAANVLMQFKKGNEFVEKLNNQSKKLGDQSQTLHYLTALCENSSNELQQQLVNSFNIKQDADKILDVLFNEIKNNLQLKELSAMVLVENNLNYIEIFENFTTQLETTRKLISDNSDADMLNAVYLFSKIVRDKLQGNLSITKLATLVETLPLIINSISGVDCVLKLSFFEIIDWHSVAVSLNVIDLIKLLSNPQQDELDYVMELLLDDDFSIYAKKALYFALNEHVKSNKKIDLHQLINLLKDIPNAKISMLDSVHLFKEEKINSWLDKVQIFTVCKLIRSINVESMEDYATINAVLYNLLIHSKRTYVEIKEIVNCIIEASKPKTNRIYLTEVANAIYLSNISTKEIIGHIKTDIKKAVENIKFGSAHIGKNPPLTNAELCAKFIESNSSQNLSEYLPGNLEQILESIDRKSRAFYQKIANITEDDFQINKMSEFNFLNSVNGNTVAEREAQFKQNFVDIMSCLIAVYAKANQGNIAYNTQILSVLVSMYSCDSPKMQQIKTGEGKTLIVALTAAVLFVKKFNVDIVTSNRGLAATGQAENEKFFKLLNITCDRCCYVEDINKNKDSFAKNIVYGTIDSFQSKILDNRFEEVSPAYSERYKKPVAILVDEADNGMVDKAGHMLYNASNHPYFKLIENVLILVFSTTLGMIYELRKAKNKDGVYNLISESVNNQINDNSVQVPEEIRTFCLNNTKFWAESAYYSMHMTNLDTYIISKSSKLDKKEFHVLIIDKLTGYEEFSTKWMYALTQYIEMINGLMKSELSLKSNFISNYAFFKSYGKNLYGVTGTVGDSYTVGKYRDLYDIETFIIPPYRNSALRMTAYDVAYGTDVWLEIISNRINEIAKSQPIEIVCENVLYAKKIAKILKKLPYAVHKYYLEKHDDCIEKLNHNKDINGFEGIQKGDVIVTTNRGGRGTDIKVNYSDKLNGKGSPKGLHVIVAFMPVNEREANQILGRTARNGNPGSASYIVNLPHAEPTNGSLMNYLNAVTLRDDNDIRRLKHDIDVKTPSLELEEKLNLLYVECYRKLEKVLDNVKYKELNLSKQQIKLILSNFTTIWSMWLNANQEKIKNVAKDLEPENRRMHLQVKSTSIEQEFEDNFNKYISDVTSCQDMFKADGALAITSFNWLSLSNFIGQMEILPKPEIENFNAEQGEISKELQFQESCTVYYERQDSLRAEFKKLCIYNAISLNEPTGAAHLMAATLYGKKDLKNIIYHLKEARYLLHVQHGQISSSKEGFNLIRKYLKLQESSNRRREEQLSDHEKILIAHLSIIDTLAGKKLSINDIRKLILEEVNDKTKKLSEADKKLKDELIDFLKQEKVINVNQIRKKWQNVAAKNSINRGYSEKFNLLNDLRNRLRGIATYIDSEELINYLTNKPKNDRNFIFSDIEKHVRSYEAFFDVLYKESIINVSTKDTVIAIDLSTVITNIFGNDSVNYHAALIKTIDKLGLQEDYANNKQLFIKNSDLPILNEIGFMKFYHILKDKGFVQDAVDCWEFNFNVDFSSKNYGVYNNAKFYDPRQGNKEISIDEFLKYLYTTYKGKLYSIFVLFPKKQQIESLIQNYLHMHDILKDKFLRSPIQTEVVPAEHKGFDGETVYEVLRHSIDLKKFRVTDDELFSLYNLTKSQLKNIEENFALGFVDFMHSNLVRELKIDLKNLDYFIALNLDRFLSLDIRKDDSEWRFAAAMLGLVGMLEIAIGCILIYTTLAAPLGVFLINEGISDLLYAYQALETERFDLHEYCAHKAISIFVNSISVGISYGGSNTVPTLGKVLVSTTVNTAVNKTMDYIYLEAINRNFHKIIKDLKSALANGILRDLKGFLVKICAYYDGTDNDMQNIEIAFNALNASNDIVNNLSDEISKEVGRIVNAAVSALKAIAQKIDATEQQHNAYKYCILAAKQTYDLVELSNMIQSNLKSIRKMEEILKFKFDNFDVKLSTEAKKFQIEKIYKSEFDNAKGGVYQLKERYSSIETNVKKCIDVWFDKALNLTLEPAWSELSAAISNVLTTYSSTLLPNGRDERLLEEISKSHENKYAKIEEVLLPEVLADDEAIENSKAIKKAKQPAKIEHLSKEKTKDILKQKIVDFSKENNNDLNSKDKKTESNEHQPVSANKPPRTWYNINEAYPIFGSKEGFLLQYKVGALTLKEDPYGITYNFFEKKPGEKETKKSSKRITIGKKISLDIAKALHWTISYNGEDFLNVSHSFGSFEVGGILDLDILEKGEIAYKVEAGAMYYIHRTQAEFNPHITMNYSFANHLTMGVKCGVDLYVGRVGTSVSLEGKISPNKLAFSGNIIPNPPTLLSKLLPTPGLSCKGYIEKPGLFSYFTDSLYKLIDQMSKDANRNMLNGYDQYPNLQDSSYKLDAATMNLLLFSPAIRNNNTYGEGSSLPLNSQTFLDAYNQARARKFNKP